MLKFLIKFDKLLLGAMMAIPWLTIPFIDKRTFQRFYPSSIMICVFVTIESIIAHKQKWWLFYKKLIPYTVGEIPLITGPFFVGTLWILKFTFGNFKRYFLVNFIIDFIFTFVMTDWFRRIGLASLLKLKKFQFLLLFLSKSVFLYLFQLFWDRAQKN